METSKATKVSVPINKIKELIKLAKDNNLAMLEVGPIKIVPQPTPLEGDLNKKSEYERVIEKAFRNGKPLSDQQKDDMLLFGPNGIIDDEH